MKLVLLQPPVQDFYDTDIRIQPVGLCYLKATLKKLMPDLQVVVKDYHQGWGRRTIPIPKELAYLKNYYCWPDKSPFATFYHYYHFGAPFQVLADDVVREKPDLVGISALFTPYFREVLRCAEEIKKRANVPIIVGGSHVSASPHSIIQHPWVDYIIRGEGERPLVEFLMCWQHGRPLDQVPNLGFKRNGQIILNDMKENFPLSEIPAPDLSDLSPAKYLYNGKPLTFIFTSRGCPHLCTFCAVHLTFGRRYRKRPVQEVLQEIKLRYDQGYRVFDFEDDTLAYSIGELKALCQKLIEIIPAGRVQYLAMNGISFWHLDDELLRLMRLAGFTHLNLSPVSFTSSVLEGIKRPGTIAQYQDVVQKAFDLGFKTVSYQILGLPNEKLNSMIRTLRHLSQLPVLLGPSIFYLTPNTPIAKDFPHFSEADLVKSRLTAMAIETDNFDRDDIFTLYVTSRIINFLKSIQFDSEQISLAQVLRMTNGLGTRAALGADILEKLLSKSQLFAATKNGCKPVPRFKMELFCRVWNKLEKVVTQEGRVIEL